MPLVKHMPPHMCVVLSPHICVWYKPPHMCVVSSTYDLSHTIYLVTERQLEYDFIIETLLD
uniref:Uncharacterized protein n=1 Tax=Arion vulgaris TaxID=1028688 RepID=A0A0B6YTR0_9EUPU